MNAERGRPRSFDIDTALDQATQVFWRHGFQATSMSELTAATGLSKPSLYAAFGDKEALYLRCLQRYAARQADMISALLENEPDARRAVQGLLRTSVAIQSDPHMPGGCFVVTGTANCGNSATPAAVDTALRSSAGSAGQHLLQRLKRAEREGDLPPGTDAKRLATLFGTVLTGMAVMAKTGQPRSRLEEAVDAAMLVWPEPAKARRKAAVKAR
jgi:TetR/AcrR family transcriptional regulator, copper-responsive repressor